MIWTLFSVGVNMPCDVNFQYLGIKILSWTFRGLCTEETSAKDDAKYLYSVYKQRQTDRNKL